MNVGVGVMLLGMGFIIDFLVIWVNWKVFVDMVLMVCLGVVVKVDVYGFGVVWVVFVLYQVGVWDFFVVFVSEGCVIWLYLFQDVCIFVLLGYMEGEDLVGLILLLNSFVQFFCDWVLCLCGLFGIQLDSGMNCLGFELGEWVVVWIEVLVVVL